MKKTKKKNKFVRDERYGKLLRIAGISGIASIFFIGIIILSFFILSDFLSFFGVFILLVSSSYFLYGFHHIGRKRNSKLLSVSAKIFVLVNIAFFLFITLGSHSLDKKFVSFNKELEDKNITFDENIFSENQDVREMFVSHFSSYIGAIIIYFFIYIIFIILFNIAIMKLNEIKYAKNTGRVGIASVLCFVSVIGVSFSIPLFIANYILLIVILFKESALNLCKTNSKKIR